MQKGKHYSIFVYFFSFYLRLSQAIPSPRDLQGLFRLQFHWFVGGAAHGRILASILLVTEHGKTCRKQVDQMWGPWLLKDLKLE